MVFTRLFTPARRINSENIPPETPGPPVPQTPSPANTARSPFTPRNLNATGNRPGSLLSSIKNKANIKKKKIFLNGFEKTPKTPNFKPFSLQQSNGKRMRAFEFEAPDPLQPLDELTANQWNELAVKHSLLKNGQELLEFQYESANHIIQRSGDLCVIAPTGSGKSLVWVLPLLAQKRGVSLVVVPYKSLGAQGERRHWGTALECTHLHSKSNSDATLARVAGTKGPHIVYVCPEMLETPAVARVLYSSSFKAVLSAIYIDEAHNVHENMSWRPSYMNLHLLRKVVGRNIPLICLSATLPETHRASLEAFVGLKEDYALINLGNFRPELSLIIAAMEHDANSFQDLRFVVPWNASSDTIKKTIVYSDDIDLLTAMFWWFYSRLNSMSLPTSLLDILHAGLSDEHDKICTSDFTDGQTRILLGTEKIGAGMDFPGVEVVVQYKCRDLSLVQLEQRRGRAARGEGSDGGVCVLLVEKSMMEGDISSRKGQDTGLLELINASSCQQAVVDQWIENPPRPQETCTRCSRCNPALRLASELTWISFEPPMEPAETLSYAVPTTMSNTTTTVSKAAAAKAKEDAVKAVYQDLVRWRDEEWEKNWTGWPLYGPDSLVPDADLTELSQKATQITTLEHLWKKVHIVHWDELSQPLLAALMASVERHYVTRYSATTPPPQTPSTDRDVPTAGPILIQQWNEWTPEEPTSSSSTNTSTRGQKRKL